MKPIYSNILNGDYSIGEKVFFIPTMTGLYGLQFLWFYKLTHVLIRNTHLLLSRPDILVYVPNGLLYIIDPHLITLKQYVIESELEPPPMPEELEDLMTRLSNWEKTLKDHLVEKESMDLEELELESESECESNNGSEIQGHISSCSEPRHGLEIQKSEIEEDYEMIDNIHEDIPKEKEPKESDIHTMKQLLSDIFTNSIYASTKKEN
jgi:hypothetical protein